MALAVDTGDMLNRIIPRYERALKRVSTSRVDRSRERLLRVQRVCVYAIVIHDPAIRDQFDNECGYDDPKQKAALEWQAEQGDDEDEVEVLHHLKQLAATTTKPGVGSSRGGSGGVQSRAGTTTLVASVQSPTFTSCTHHRPPYSFRRYFTRLILETGLGYSCWFGGNDMKNLIPDFGASGISGGEPRIISADAEARYHSVISLVQFDVFDLSSWCLNSASSPPRRRRTLNPFHHVSPTRDEDHTARAHDYPAREAKRFKGVRYRPDHNRWVAEMKPPKSKNKVSFGEFRSEIHAARVVDVAFHHYGRPLNFPKSTPRLLSSKPSSAGLSEEATREVVRNQTEWMKSRVSSEPSPDRSTSDTNSGLRPFSAIGSSLIFVGTDESDDAVSQPQLDWLQELVSSVGMAEGQGTWGVADGFGDGAQSSPTQCSVESSISHDPSGVFGISPEHFGGVLTTGSSFQTNLDPPRSRFEFSDESWIPEDVFAACSLFPMGSPGAFQMEGADGCWEQEIAGVGLE